MAGVNSGHKEAARAMGRTTLAVKSATDLGLKRTQNEDSHGLWAPEDDSERDRRGVLMVVADGMGGSQAGVVASRLAVDTVIKSYEEADGGDLLENLQSAVLAANEAVHAESQAHPDLTGMGTTCTAVVVQDRHALVAHVGDSRAYLVRDAHIRKLTRDHSLVAQLVQRRELTPEQARLDPRRNVVTRSVGVGPEVEVDAERLDVPLLRGDTLLLCSDGLHGLVGDDELAEVASGQNLDEACAELIAMANDRGGPDNITVVLARVEDLDDTLDLEPKTVSRAAGAAPARTSTRTMMMWLIVALVVLLLALVGIFWLVQRLGQNATALDHASARDVPSEGTWA